MKTLIALTLIFSANAFAGEVIHCTDSATDSKKVVAKLVRMPDDSRGHQAWNLNMDESISSAYFSVEDLTVVKEKSENADKLSDWNGNYGVDLEFPKGFLDSKRGTKGIAKVKAYYDDHVQDEVNSVLDCKVIK